MCVFKVRFFSLSLKTNVTLIKLFLFLINFEVPMALRLSAAVPQMARCQLATEIPPSGRLKSHRQSKKPATSFCGKKQKRYRCLLDLQKVA